MRKTNRLWTIRPDGHLKLTANKEINKLRSKPDTLWNHPIFLVIVVGLCMLVDFFNFKHLFDSFLLTASLARASGIIAFLIAYDAIPLWLGIALKKKSQGYKVDQLMIYIMIAVFVLAFAINVGLRIATKDIILPESSKVYSDQLYGTVTSTATNQTDSSLVLMYAIFVSVIPVITSLASGTISYLMANPLKKEKLRCEEELDQIKESMSMLRTVLAEYENNSGYLERLWADDDAKYASAKGTIEAHKAQLIHYTRQKLEEHLGDPTSTNILSKPMFKEVV